MPKKAIDEVQLPALPPGQVKTKQKLPPEPIVLLCTFAFVLCVLIMIAPLKRLAGTPETSQMPLGNLLARVGAWLPTDLHLYHDPASSRLGTANVEFLLLMALAFLIYGVCALFIQRQPEQRKNLRTLQLIWLGAVVAGLIFLLAPALLSHDVFVYAAYGRLLNVYHANPYFVPLSAYPHDAIYPLDYWSGYTSAYGPLWLLISSLSELVSGTHPLGYVIFFRSLGLAAHLLNILLVTRILRTMGRSSRTISLGTQLYAWNPLVLLEASHGAHNDILMLTFILLGMLMGVSAEKKGLTHLRRYILPLVAFTLAALVKYAAAPLIILFIIALACKTLRSANSTHPGLRESLALRLKPTLLAVLAASIISGTVALIFYGPFLVGHSIHAILESFSSPPSSQATHKSLVDALIEWRSKNPLPPHTVINALVYQLSRHSIWNIIDGATLALTLVMGAFWLWKNPTMQTFALASLATLGALLLVVPWFLPWYVTWLVELAVVCLPVTRNRTARALLAFTLTFSASAFFLYLYNSAPPAFGWDLYSCLLTYGPPILAFLIAFFLWRAPHQPVRQATAATIQEKVRV